MYRDDLRAAPTPEAHPELQGTELEPIAPPLPESSQVKDQVQVTEEGGSQERGQQLHLPVAKTGWDLPRHLLQGFSRSLGLSLWGFLWLSVGSLDTF